MAKPEHPIQPGQTVTVTQQIPHGQHAWTTGVTGEVVCVEQRKTGSWFAHAKDDKLWLDRLILRKADGEIVQCILDGYTQVTVLADAPLPDPATHDTGSDGVQEADAA